MANGKPLSRFGIKEVADVTFYKINNDGTATITGYTGEETGDLQIPKTIFGYTVTAIGNWAFDGCTGFTGSLILPDCLTSVGMYAMITTE
jgi:hypothetical protein